MVLTGGQDRLLACNDHTQARYQAVQVTAFVDLAAQARKVCSSDSRSDLKLSKIPDVKDSDVSV